MDTLKRLFILSALMAAAVGCSPANADRNNPSASNTEITSSIPTDTPAADLDTLSTTNTELTSPYPTFTQTAPATSTPVPSRDISTSSKRLVGHWGKHVDGEIDRSEQCFFGDLNAEGIGEYYEVSQGDYFEGTYSILSEDLDTAEVIFVIKSVPNEIVIPLKVSEDGLFFYVSNSEASAEYQYMDSITKPEDLSPIIKKYKYE